MRYFEERAGRPLTTREAAEAVAASAVGLVVLIIMMGVAGYCHNL